LDEVLGADQLKATLEERDLVAYWGTAPTGRRESSLRVELFGKHTVDGERREEV
jgi:hypothetical protein